MAAVGRRAELQADTTSTMPHDPNALCGPWPAPRARGTRPAPQLSRPAASGAELRSDISGTMPHDPNALCGPRPAPQLSQPAASGASKGHLRHRATRPDCILFGAFKNVSSPNGISIIDATPVNVCLFMDSDYQHEHSAWDHAAGRQPHQHSQFLFNAVSALAGVFKLVLTIYYGAISLGPSSSKAQWAIVLESLSRQDQHFWTYRNAQRGLCILSGGRAAQG